MKKPKNPKPKKGWVILDRCGDFSWWVDLDQAVTIYRKKEDALSELWEGESLARVEIRVLPKKRRAKR